MLSDLANCLSSEKLMMLDNSLIGSIATETEDSLFKRRRISEKLQILKEGMLTLNHFSRYKPTGRLYYILDLL